MLSGIGGRALARLPRLSSLPSIDATTIRQLSHKAGAKVPTQLKLDPRATAVLLNSTARSAAPVAASAAAESAAPAVSVAETPKPEGKWRDFAGAAALLTAVLGLLGWGLASWSSASFRDRRVKAVKERMKRTLKTAAPPQPAGESTKGAGAETLPLFDRPYASSVVAPITETAGLYMVCGPKGEGKSSLMEQLEQRRSFVIRADLQNGSIDKAVRAVAAAMNYSLDYTADEQAAKALSFNVPAINAQQGIADFEELLLVFEQACNELRVEGALGKSVPVLILDHANRPKPGPQEDPKASLIYTMVEIGHRIANQRTASWAAVTSDPQQEHEAWTKAGGRDSLMPIRAPPFSQDEARELLARAIFERCNPKTTPKAEQLDAIKKDYAETLKFVTGAVGTRARWLLRLLQFRKVIMSDVDLKASGGAVDPAFFPYLPAELHDAELRVDPLVWQQFSNLVTERKQALKPLLEVPYNFALPPVKPATPSPEDLAADRVLATDAALRDLLKAAEGKGAAEEKPAPAAKGVPVGLAFEALHDKYFEGQDGHLRELCDKHVLFYNHGACTVEFESELMQRITASWLADPRHKNRMQLVRKLQEWQKAKGQQAEAERSLAQRKGTWAGTSALVGKLSSAEERVEQLEGEIDILRGKLRLLPQD